MEEIFLGYTTKTFPEVIEHCEDLTSFQFEYNLCPANSFHNNEMFLFRKYDVIKENCNHFSDELSYRLCGKGIPNKYLMQASKAVSIATIIVGSIVLIGATVIRFLMKM